MIYSWRSLQEVDENLDLPVDLFVAEFMIWMQEPRRMWLNILGCAWVCVQYAPNFSHWPPAFILLLVFAVFWTLIDALLLTQHGSFMFFCYGHIAQLSQVRFLLTATPKKQRPLRWWRLWRKDGWSTEEATLLARDLVDFRQISSSGWNSSQKKDISGNDTFAKVVFGMHMLCVFFFFFFSLL